MFFLLCFFLILSEFTLTVVWGFSRCASLQKSLEFEDLGPKRIAALEKEAEEWRMKAEDAVASIQDITVTYFAQTSKALAGTIRFVYFAYLRVNPLMKDLLTCSSVHSK